VSLSVCSHLRVTSLSTCVRISGRLDSLCPKMLFRSGTLVLPTTRRQRRQFDSSMRGLSMLSEDDSSRRESELTRYSLDSLPLSATDPAPNVSSVPSAAESSSEHKTNISRHGSNESSDPRDRLCMISNAVFAAIKSVDSLRLQLWLLGFFCIN
jgi:hypothetical protein